MCHSLSDQSVRAATVLGSWSEYPRLIPSDKFTAAFNAKNKHLKGKNQEEGDAHDNISSPEVTVVK